MDAGALMIYIGFTFLAFTVTFIVMWVMQGGGRG